MKTRQSRWLWLAFLSLAAVGCGGGDGAPTAPTPATPSFAGTWAGMGRLQQCTGTPVPCPPGSVGSQAPMELTLTQTGTTVSGTWTINGAEPRVPVTGSIAADGSLNLSGRSSPEATVDASRLTVAGTAMAGTITYTFQGVATIVVALEGVTRR